MSFRKIEVTEGEMAVLCEALIHSFNINTGVGLIFPDVFMYVKVNGEKNNGEWAKNHNSMKEN